MSLNFVMMMHTNVTMETALINHWLTTAEMTVEIIVMKVTLFSNKSKIKEMIFIKGSHQFC